MKRTFITLLVATICASAVTAQNFNDKKDLLPISIVIQDQPDPLPIGARTYAITKLKQIAANNGVAANENFSRFFITLEIMPTTKDILPGPPMKISQNSQVTFFLCDYFDQKIFASTSIDQVGVGDNETKCFINIVKGINTKSPQLAEFMEEGKQKVIDYYNANCDNIIKKAESLSFQKDYEAALYELTSVPEVCDCYDRALAKTKEVYQAYIDYMCDVNLAQAKAAWAAEQNSEGAKKAGEFMANILPDAKCYGDAQTLYSEIKGKVLDDWKFEMKMWQDNVDLEKQRIDAARQVGIAYGNHQQPTSYLLPWVR
ncbi:MAG: hypothetical protein MJ003_06170 [Paludibacteraceae bacterium]|nr:hypothetical protein [Paludibacteraceae bacterium]